MHMPRWKRTTELVFVITLFVIFSTSVYGAFPKPIGYVNDFAGVMTNQEISEIDSIAKGLKDNQGIELAVVTIDTVDPYPVNLYAADLFNEWGIGGPEDSGLLILLAITEREIKVEVGYGLEGALPSGKVGGILDEYVMEYLRADNYGKGLVEATKAFNAALAGESYEKSEENESHFPVYIILWVIVVIVSLLSRSRRFPRTPNTFGGPYTKGPSIGGSRYTGFGGRGGSGGFGGFGGGRSGGGGAGRKF